MITRSNATRRHFVHAAIGAGGLVLLPEGLWAQQAQQPAPATAPQQAPAASTRPRPPKLEAALVEEFVRVAHGNFERTQQMLDATPALLNATWDWGGGDWEAAIGGAGHMGRKDIAGFLLSRGARMDIFVAAMLGRLDILQPTLDAYPELLHSRGPHGISLMRHARAGGAEAEAVAEFLRSKGVTE